MIVTTTLHSESGQPRLYACEAFELVGSYAFSIAARWGGAERYRVELRTLPPDPANVAPAEIVIYAAGSVIARVPLALLESELPL